MQRLRLVALLLLLAGCTSGGTAWKNPSLPPGQALSDERSCRRSAEEDMGPRAYSDPGSEKFDTPLEMYDRSEQRGHFQALVADCMERKGYRRADQQ